MAAEDDGDRVGDESTVRGLGKILALTREHKATGEGKVAGE